MHKYNATIDYPPRFTADGKCITRTVHTVIEATSLTTAIQAIVNGHNTQDAWVNGVSRPEIISVTLKTSH